jgi:sugar phosphate isomerase/epimerase
MRPIGFSTGALALGDFRRGLDVAAEHGFDAVELSALRAHELEPLIEALPSLELSQFRYVSLHAPSRYEEEDEKRIVALAAKAMERGIPVVVHPDAIRDAAAWRQFGAMVLIENMDRRKPIGRSVTEMDHFFDLLPEAGFCFDIGHARQFDPSMTEAGLLLAQYRRRIRQIHVSEVNTASKHERLSYLSYFSLRRVADRIPNDAPVILEAVVTPEQIRAEVEFARECLAPRRREEEAARPALDPVPAEGR